MPLCAAIRRLICRPSGAASADRLRRPEAGAEEAYFEELRTLKAYRPARNILMWQLMGGHGGPAPDGIKGLALSAALMLVARPVAAVQGSTRPGTRGCLLKGRSRWRRRRRSRAMTLAPYLDQSALAAAWRAGTLSVNPEQEDVLILAHGPEDDAENERWLQAIDQRAELVRDGLPFHEVNVMSLREDWEAKREVAEREVRSYVAKAQAEGRRAIVIPYRVHGFGPYEDVLEGLDYVADGAGLIPHPAVSRWIAEQAEAMRP